MDDHDVDITYGTVAQHTARRRPRPLCMIRFGTASRDAAAHPLAGVGAVAQQHHDLSRGMSAAFGVAAIFDVVTLLLVMALFRSAPPAPPVTAPAAERDEVFVPGVIEDEELG